MRRPSYDNPTTRTSVLAAARGGADAPDARRDGLLLFFCHHGLACVSIGHLLDIAPPQLLDGFFLPPASVTVLHSEEREPGIAAFRCQCMGDTSHLRAAGLPVSRSGAFGEPFPG